MIGKGRDTQHGQGRGRAGQRGQGRAEQQSRGQGRAGQDRENRATHRRAQLDWVCARFGEYEIFWVVGLLV
jgi:hypothetical protein